MDRNGPKSIEVRPNRKLNACSSKRRQKNRYERGWAHKKCNFYQCWKIYAINVYKCIHDCIPYQLPSSKSFTTHIDIKRNMHHIFCHIWFLRALILEKSFVWKGSPTFYDRKQWKTIFLLAWKNGFFAPNLEIHSEIGNVKFLSCPELLQLARDEQE